VAAARSRKWLAFAWGRTRRQSRVLARTSRTELARGSAWTAATSRETASSLRTASSAAAAWTASTAKATARRSTEAASAAYGWASAHVPMSRMSWHAKSNGRNDHRALVVRQCTALIRYEPQRGSHPTIRPN
jgi:hypothetical protein